MSDALILEALAALCGGVDDILNVHAKVHIEDSNLRRLQGMCQRAALRSRLEADAIRAAQEKAGVALGLEDRSEVEGGDVDGT